MAKDLGKLAYLTGFYKYIQSALDCGAIACGRKRGVGGGEWLHTNHKPDMIIFGLT